MLPYQACLLCGKPMSGFVFYHKDCFVRKQKRFYTKGVYGFIRMNTLSKPSLEEINEIENTHPKIFAENKDWLNLYTFVKAERSVEKELVRLSDIEIFAYRHKILWNYFSSKYQNQHPEEFWKFAPYMDWSLFSSQEHLPEDLIFKFSHSIVFEKVKPQNYTKKVMMKLHSKIDWNRAVRSPHFDKEVFKRMYQRYPLRHDLILDKIELSNYEVNQLIKIKYFPIQVFLSRKKLSFSQLRMFQKLEFSEGKINQYLKYQQFPEDILRSNVDNLDWKLIKKTQRKLTPNFIIDYSTQLKSKKKKTGSDNKQDHFTLRPILNRNGFGKIKDRSQSLNKFLISNKLI